MAFINALGPYQTLVDDISVCTIVLEKTPSFNDLAQSLECRGTLYTKSKSKIFFSKIMGLMPTPMLSTCRGNITKSLPANLIFTSTPSILRWVLLPVMRFCHMILRFATWCLPSRGLLMSLLPFRWME